MEAAQRTLLPNPREKASLLSIINFWWTLKFFKTGYSKVLDLGDLYRPLKKDRSEILGDLLENQWKEQLKNSKHKPSLIKATIFTFWKDFSLMALIVILNECVRLGQPLLLGRLILYFREDTNISHKEALLYGGGLVLFSLFYGILNNQYFHNAFYYGMRVRVAMCSLIYRKALKLSRTALGDTAPGKIVNLLSNDVNRFDMVIGYMHMLWVSPLFAILIIYLMWQEVGSAATVGLLVIFTITPLQSYSGKLTSRFRLQVALKTDERVRFMDEIISGVQVIKMYAWEKAFSKLITIARKLELKAIRRCAFIRAVYVTFVLFTTRMAIFCTMLTMVLMKFEITASQIFVIMTYFNIVSHIMSQTFVRGVAEIAEGLVAFKRLHKFLMYEERDDSCIARTLRNNDDLSKKYLISLNNVTAKWKMPEKLEKKKSKEKSDTDASEGLWTNNLELIAPTLDNICLECKEGTLIGIIGEVGSGKSSLLQVILKELPLESGTLQSHGTISYAGQDPWIFSSSIRQNILFGQEFDKERYDIVVKACALSHDLKQFPFGDQTIIGERGASLSGGQKARINLARAVYRKADIYLFDDPLSAVDAHVGKHLFDQVIGPNGHLGLRRTTRILVTHQVHFLKDADWLIVLKDGQIKVQGSPHDVIRNNIEVANLLNTDDTLHKEDTEGLKVSRHLSHSSLCLDDESDKLLKKDKDDKVQPAVVSLENSSKGTVKGLLFFKYLLACGNWALLIIMFLIFLITQSLASGFDWFIAYWTAQEELRNIYNYNSSFEDQKIILNNKTEYIMENEIPALLYTAETCTFIAGALVILLFLFGLVRSLAFYTMCIKASQRLHDGMFKGIISTKMRFFDTNPSGRILNRFSKDLGATDEHLPKAMLDASQIILNMCGTIVVIIIVNPIFLTPIVGLAIIFFFVTKIHLKTSKNVKRLEGITRSPVFTHIGATLTGLPTIRALRTEKILTREFDALQNIHSASCFMYISATGAYGYAIEVICVLFMFIVIFTFLILDTNAIGGNVGLAITQIISLAGFLQWGIRQCVEVVNQLVAVERVIEYREMIPESEREKLQVVPKYWPDSGKLKMKNVYYRYYKNAEPVLKDINISIKTKEKIGIVGRTGAGKSSLIGTIFRLAEVEGTIAIDGVNTEQISLQSLRSKVSIIPQDPVLFSGTLRRNLDPFEEYKDDALWKALEEVELKDIANGPKALEADVLAGGSNYSVGQRQLICLARALLRNNKILILDEATANVDPNTDALIQQTIRTRFANCTVLTVAHRLHTIMDSDRVLVMSDGLIAEFDVPHILLQNNKGILREMVNATGPQESERLIKIANEAFEANSKQLA